MPPLRSDTARDFERMLVDSDNPEALVAQHGFVTAQEPACGSGGMVIAFAKAMLERGLNPQQQLHVTATDLDVTAVHMAVIQLGLCGIPARIVHGDTLKLETFSTYETPHHHLGFWDMKLRRRAADAPMGAPATPAPAPVAPIPESIPRKSQLTLF